MYSLRWPTDATGKIVTMGNLTMVELFADYLSATGAMPPVPWAKGWATEQEFAGAKLVNRTLHQHALLMNTAVNIPVKNGILYKMPATTQSPVLVPEEPDLVCVTLSLSA